MSAPDDRGWIARIGAIADKPGDEPEQLQRHRFLLLTGVVMSGGGLVWGSAALLGGLGWRAAVPYAYTLITLLNFTALSRTKNIAVARTIQVLISLLLPFLFQWVLGGFVASGAVMIWAMLAVVASFSFDDTRVSLLWIALYLTLTVVSGFVENSLPVPEIMRSAALAPYTFAINIFTVSAAVLGLTSYFVAQRRLAIAELADKNRQIAESHQALIQSEKMAALGQLVAGVAHELNTPLGAIRASVGNMSTALDGSAATLDRLAKTAEARRADWFALVRRAGARTAPRTSREERSARGRVARELETAGISDGESLAGLLVDMGLDGADGEVAPFLDLLRDADRDALLESAHAFAAIARSSRNIQTASDRAAKIVFALKSYAHPGGAGGAPTRASLAENLDTVLALYHNQIKHGVDLARDYQDPGEVEARHDELNQVWTNLVHNALQAMNPEKNAASSERAQRRLGVSVRAVGDDAWVSITDNGSGIPQALMQKIFDPFFTTKAAGEGSGLGLSICRDIVEKHGGAIEVESEPGRTCFTVRIPRAAKVGGAEAGRS